VDLEDDNKDGNSAFDDFFLPNFNLPIGNFSEIVDSLVRRHKDDTVIQARTNMQVNFDPFRDKQKFSKFRKNRGNLSVAPILRSVLR